MNYRGSYRHLLNNAKAAMLAAIEIYNKPRFAYRDECFVILVLNAWELVFKALLSKNGKSVFYPKKRKQPYRTLSWQDALGRAESVFPKTMPLLPVRRNLDLLSTYRDNAVHFYNAQGFGSIVYTLAQTSVMNFRDLLYDAFNVKLEEDITWQLLPLGIKPPIDPIAYMAKKQEDVDKVTAALSVGKLVDLANAFCRWEPVAECPRNVLGAARIKPSWDFAEGAPIGDASGSFSVCLDNLVSGMQSIGDVTRSASIQIAAAQESPLPSDSADCWFTDPPYYDAVPYADLSDFFLVWLKRALPGHVLLRDPFDSSNLLSPKKQEAVQDETKTVDGRLKDRVFFEETMAKAFADGRRVLKEDGIGSVVFAHKTTEGWEALLTGMIAGGWTITGSWPIVTEAANRLRARDSAALATSVHLVCRPRTEDIVGDWGEVLRELPKRVGDWMERLQAEHVRGADLVFACIGPALEIFSRYSKVETAEGHEVTLAEYLAKVWEVVGRSALEQILGTAEAKARNGAAGALEEDARLTALFLWTLQSTDALTPGPSPGGRGENNGAGGRGEDEGDDDDEEEKPGKKKPGFSLVFDVARRFAQPLGIHLPDWEGRIIETQKGIVRLLPVAERAKQLFGEEGAYSAAAAFERNPVAAPQMVLFPEEEAVAPKVKGKKRKSLTPGPFPGGRGEDETARREATTLDRIHAAMLLQRAGRSNAMRALIGAEQERGTEFLRLANALTALYPRDSEEKRLLDAMLLAVPR